MVDLLLVFGLRASYTSASSALGVLNDQRYDSVEADSPGRDITSLLHEGTECEPETVTQRKVGGDFRSVTGVVADLPLGRAEPADQEHHQADAEVREDDAQPDVEVERVHEREDAGLLFLRLLDHDADAELHERLAEVDHSLAHRRDRQRRHGDVRHLHIQQVSNEKYPFCGETDQSVRCVSACVFGCLSCVCQLVVGGGGVVVSGVRRMNEVNTRFPG